MKYVTSEQVKRLELISTRIEKAKAAGQSGKVVDDLEYLTQELRNAYKKIEELVNSEEAV